MNLPIKLNWPLCSVASKLRPHFMTVLTAMLVILLSSTIYAQTPRPLLGFEVYGHGPEKVLVLHSWIDDASSFDLAKIFWDTDLFTFVFVELRGYGRSRHIPGNYTAEEAAQDAFHVADTLGWDTFHLVGHSMSGMIVQRMALNDWKRHHTRIKSVVAITPVTADGYPADEETRDFLGNLIHNPELSHMMVNGLTGGRLLPSWSRIVTDKYMSIATPEAMRGYYDMWVNDDFSREAASAHMETPIFVIAGSLDFPGFLASYYQQTFAEWYPNVSITTITDAGHFPMYETPVYLATLVEKFLKKHSAGSRLADKGVRP